MIHRISNPIATASKDIRKFDIQRPLTYSAG
jgi:hypothetical protein